MEKTKHKKGLFQMNERDLFFQPEAVVIIVCKS